MKTWVVLKPNNGIIFSLKKNRANPIGKGAVKGRYWIDTAIAWSFTHYTIYQDWLKLLCYESTLYFRGFYSRNFLGNARAINSCPNHEMQVSPRLYPHPYTRIPP